MYPTMPAAAKRTTRARTSQSNTSPAHTRSGVSDGSASGNEGDSPEEGGSFGRERRRAPAGGPQSAGSPGWLMGMGRNANVISPPSMSNKQKATKKPLGQPGVRMARAPP